MTNILSGEQLVHTHSKANRELPPIGTKDFQPTHSWLEKKQIENALQERKDLLEEERVEKQSCLMTAEWVPKMHKAEVTQKNKNWEVFGHHSDNADWLFPEEVLYLLEMNCLECLFGEVPLSIQKGYSVLLKPEHGCSFHEFRVFAHLCRTGYRVVRHLSNLTVTAYERQIRLDQHVEHRKTYDFNNSFETELPRPDLPPKKVLDLPENTEISINCDSLPTLPLNIENNILTKVESNEASQSRSEKQPPQTSIEIIDVLDSSEESSSDESSSDDSDIEIIHESPPKKINVKSVILCDNNDSDVEVVEVPALKKEIIVETIESSDSEQEEEESSESDSDKSYDGNWKRGQPSNKKSRYTRHPSLIHYKFSSVQEFCSEKCAVKETITKYSQSKDVENDKTVSDNENNDDCGNENYSTLESTSVRTRRPKFTITKTRNEILDLMPTMAGRSIKLIPVGVPDTRLIPETIIPKQKSYTFSKNSLQARVFRTGFRGRFRGFHGQRFGNFNSFNNFPRQSAYPNQINNRPSLISNPALTQIFGSDVHSMARGMMQFASALLLQLPHNNQTNTLLPFVSQPALTFHGTSNYSRPDFESYRSVDRHQNIVDTNSSRFSNSSHSCFNSSMRGNTQHFHSNNKFPSNTLNNELQPKFRDFDFPERPFTPPISVRRGSSFANRKPTGVRSRRNYRQVGRRFPPAVPSSSSLPSPDPAYAKPDVPLCGTQNEPEKRVESVRKDDQNDMEIVEIIDESSIPLKGISNIFRRKRERKLRQKYGKRMRLKNSCVQNTNPEIVFLDSPSSNDSLANFIKCKPESGTVESESNVEIGYCVKEEPSRNGAKSFVKKEDIESGKSALATTIKSEDNNEVTVKLEQDKLRSNLKNNMECSSTDTSSLSSETLASTVKSDCVSNVKSEPDIKCEAIVPKDVKTEATSLPKDVKPEVSLNEHKVLSSNNVENPEDAVCPQQDGLEKEDTTESTSNIINTEDPSLSGNQNISMSEMESVCEMEVEESNEISMDSSEIIASSLNASNEVESNETSRCNMSNWAEVKKHNLPISNLPEGTTAKDSDSDDKEENDEEIRPLIRAKHCKTIGTVLSALQIFSPFAPQVPEDIPKLKISFDMYLPSDFRKAQRGLPHYRIAVFRGTEPMPSAAQMHELRTRFADNVPLLTAVVTLDSIVFYSSSNVSLSVDPDADVEV